MKKSRCTSQMADNGIFTFFSFPKIFVTTQHPYRKLLVNKA